MHFNIMERKYVKIYGDLWRYMKYKYTHEVQEGGNTIIHGVKKRNWSTTLLPFFTWYKT